MDNWLYITKKWNQPSTCQRNFIRNIILFCAEEEFVFFVWAMVWVVLSLFIDDQYLFGGKSS